MGSPSRLILSGGERGVKLGGCTSVSAHTMPTSGQIVKTMTASKGVVGPAGKCFLNAVRTAGLTQRLCPGEDYPSPPV